jgi:hypothetical protein
MSPRSALIVTAAIAGLSAGPALHDAGGERTHRGGREARERGMDLLSCADFDRRSEGLGASAQELKYRLVLPDSPRSGGICWELL